MFGHLGYKLLPWMAAVIWDVYGTLDVDTGLRQYRDVFVSTAKKQGKSFFLGGMPIYHLDQENEPMARAVGGATTRKQASEIFDSAVALIQANPKLQQKFIITPSSKTIAHRRSGGKYEVLSADGDRNDGCRRSLGLIDEIHRFKSDREIGMLDAVARGGRGRTQPLLFKITTAGDPTDSQVWLREYQYAKQVLAGTIKNPRYYARIYEANPERLKEDPEYWKTKEARLEANPSHEDHGGFVRDEELVEDLNRAVNIPDEQSKYWRFTLNAMAESENKYIKAVQWNACAAPLRTIVDRECYIGVDLSATEDLTAAVAVFPDETDRTYDVMAAFWVPADNVATIARQLGPMGETFQRWVREGKIRTTPGPTVNYGAVEKWIEDARQMFHVKEINPDPWNALDLMNRLIAEGYQVVKVEQRIGNLSPATKGLRTAILEGRIRHGGDEVLAWNVACATTVQDIDSNVKLKKVKRNIEAVRIDGAAALVNAFTRAMVPEEQFINASVSGLNG